METERRRMNIALNWDGEATGQASVRLGDAVAVLAERLARDADWPSLDKAPDLTQQHLEAEAAEAFGLEVGEYWDLRKKEDT
jgi:hypothetical protein